MNGRGLLVAVLLALAPSGLAAQANGSISGTVTDANRGEPIRGIQARVAGTRSLALTDAEGAYELREVPAGTHTVTFTWIGYRDQLVEVSVSSGQTVSLDVAMEPGPIMLGDVTVTAPSRAPERVIESPAAVTRWRRHGFATCG